MAAESYAPRWKVRLLMRLEEYDDKGSKRVSKAAPAPKLNSDSTAYDNIPLTYTSSAGGWFLRPKSGPTVVSPQRANLVDIEANVVPMQFNLGANGVRQADTLKMVFRYADLPFDPRVVRAAGVEFYIGTAPIDGNGDAPSYLTDTTMWPSGRIVSNLRFQGWVDKWAVTFPDDNDEPVASLECRDNTCLFIDQEHPPALVLSKKLSVSEATALYLANFPQFAGMSVQYRPGLVDSAAAKEPTLEAGHNKPSNATGSGTHAGVSGAGMGGAARGSRMSIWDFLTEVTGSIGHVIRIEGTTVVIEPPRSMTNTKTPRRDDPFQGRTVDGRQLPLRVMRIGKNVHSIELARNYALNVPKNVEVVGYNTATKSVVTIRYPQSVEERLASPKLQMNETHKQYHVLRVEISDPAQMRVIAQQVYESLNRNEIAGNLKTYSLASEGGSNAEPDLLHMRQGDAIIVAGEPADRLIRRMRSLDYPEEQIAAYTKVLTDASFQRVFYVRGVGIQGSEDEGLTLDIQFLNFIEARADVEAKAQAKEANQRAAQSLPRVTNKAPPSPPVPPPPPPAASYVPRVVPATKGDPKLGVDYAPSFWKK